MSQSKHQYMVFIRTTRERLWDVIHQPAFTSAYWYGSRQISEWRVGATWKMLGYRDNLMTSGEIIELDPPSRQVLRWRNEYDAELRDEGFSRVTMTLEDDVDTVKFTVTHEIDIPQSQLIARVSGSLDRGGWPRILNSLKSFVETGQALRLTEPLK